MSFFAVLLGDEDSNHCKGGGERLHNPGYDFFSNACYLHQQIEQQRKHFIVQVKSVQCFSFKFKM